VKRSILAGVDPLKVLWSACVTPMKTYGLKQALLQEGDPADLIVVDDLKNFEVIATYIDGILVARDGKTLLESQPNDRVNQFKAHTMKPRDFQVRATQDVVPVIEVMDGQLVTGVFDWRPNLDTLGQPAIDLDQDILKIAVLNRYEYSKPAVAYIKNFGLKEGAIASSVAHDSHNIVAVGASDEALAEVMNMVIQEQGGIAAVSSSGTRILPLPVAGIMTDDDAFKVGREYGAMDDLAKKMGSKLTAPYMTLSFMALLVIPDIKLSDKGLFDGRKFEFMDVLEAIH
jgi:adenine deaminase